MLPYSTCFAFTELNIDKAKGCFYDKGCCLRFRGLVGKTFIDGFYFLWESVISSAMPSLLK